MLIAAGKEAILVKNTTSECTVLRMSCSKFNPETHPIQHSEFYLGPSQTQYKQHILTAHTVQAPAGAYKVGSVGSEVPDKLKSHGQILTKSMYK